MNAIFFNGLNELLTSYGNTKGMHYETEKYTETMTEMEVDILF